jgi:hypothetical protein
MVDFTFHTTAEDAILANLGHHVMDDLKAFGESSFLRNDFEQSYSSITGASLTTS